jgi:hypothetical protein
MGRAVCGGIDHENSLAQPVRLAESHPPDTRHAQKVAPFWGGNRSSNGTSSNVALTKPLVRYLLPGRQLTDAASQRPIQRGAIDLQIPGNLRLRHP